jgi:hypothetical protein
MSFFPGHASIQRCGTQAPPLHQRIEIGVPRCEQHRREATPVADAILAQGLGAVHDAREGRERGGRVHDGPAVTIVVAVELRVPERDVGEGRRQVCSAE